MMIKKEHLTDEGRLKIRSLIASGLPLQQVGRQSPK
jgi:hypothetical protein